jgi:hypothetical protein
MRVITFVVSASTLENENALVQPDPKECRGHRQRDGNLLAIYSTPGLSTFAKGDR